MYFLSNEIPACPVQVLSTNLSVVNEKQIRTATVDNTCDTEVEPAESEGEDDNTINTRTDSESEQLDDDISLSTLTGSSTNKLPGPAKPT